MTLPAEIEFILTISAVINRHLLFGLESLGAADNFQNL